MVSSVDSERLEAEDAPAAEPPVETPIPPASPPGRAPLGLPALTLVIGLVVTLALVLVSESQYRSNESRLLKLRVRDASTLLNGSLPGEQSALASAAELADVTNGNVQKFMTFVAPEVKGARAAFTSVSLWRLSDLGAGPVAVAGATPKLTSSTAASLFAAAAQKQTLGVIAQLTPPLPSLGFGFVTGRYGVAAERPLPASRRSRLAANSAFTGLDYAIFLGDSENPDDLLVTNVKRLPLPAPTAAETVQFGDSSLRLVMSSRVPLPGTLPRDLPWIIAVLGTVLSLAAALMVWRLSERRRAAELLAGRLEVTAGENRRLYAEQRTIAQTLQHALLPDALPDGPQLQASARYEAGERGVDVGGDWYDVIELGDRRVLLVVGDVSGRGLRAATTMAALRYAIRAYAAEGDDPSAILTKLSRLVSVAETGQLATILCVLIDLDERLISVTSAGHLPPLLIDGDGGRFVEPDLGVPIGVESGADYGARSITLPPAGTLVAFTDGLVETRGESIDDGLERLRLAAIKGDDRDLAGLLGRLVTEVPGEHVEDDIAIVGVRWKT